MYSKNIIDIWYFGSNRSIEKWREKDQIRNEIATKNFKNWLKIAKEMQNFGQYEEICNNKEQINPFDGK